MSHSRKPRAGGMLDHPARLLTGAAVAVLLLWRIFTDSPSWHELVVGIVASALTVLFFASFLRSERLSIQLRARDLALAWHLPAAILRDCWIITVVLFKDLFGVQKAGSFYRACSFKSSRRDPLLVGRSALAVTYTTMSPNMLVIGIDPSQSLMLFHQLQPDDVPSMTRTLGGHR